MLAGIVGFNAIVMNMAITDPSSNSGGHLVPRPGDEGSIPFRIHFHLTQPEARFSGLARHVEKTEKTSAQAARPAHVGSARRPSHRGIHHPPHRGNPGGAVRPDPRPEDLRPFR